MQQSEYVLYHDDVADVFVDLCRRDADRERCNYHYYSNPNRKPLKQGIRDTNVLATKDNHRPGLKKYCTHHNGIFVLNLKHAASLCLNKNAEPMLCVFYYQHFY